MKQDIMTMPKTITLTIEVEDDFDSFNDLETFVDQEKDAGKAYVFWQKLKKELCEKLASNNAAVVSDSPCCPKCGHAESIAKGQKERKLKTIFGDVSIQQPRRQCKKCNSYFFPLGAWLDNEGNVTSQLKEVATLCAASWPYEVASRTLERLTGASVCAKEIQLLTEQIACEAKEDETEGYIEALSTTTNMAMEQLNSTSQSAETPEGKRKRVYSRQGKPFLLSFDGIYVHSWEKLRGIEGKVGIIFADGEHEKTEISKGRNLFLNKEYIASFETSETLAQKAYAVVWNNNFIAEEMIMLGDGARWIPKIRDNYFPQARYILDWWHLKENVKRCLRDTVENQKIRWRKAKQVLSLLWRGRWREALKVLDQLIIQTKDGQKQVSALRKYLLNNAEGIIDYKAFKQAGYYISSCVVEKTAYIIVARRQKHQGMIWTRKGADAIAVLRTIVLNGKWDSYWQENRVA